MENPERIWTMDGSRCRKGCGALAFSGPGPCLLCGVLKIEYIRADLAAPLPRPSDEPLRDAVPR